MKFLKSLLFGITASAALFIGAGAQAQGYQPNFYSQVSLPTTPTTIVGSSTSNLTTTAITVRQGAGIAFFAYSGCTNSSTATATLHFDVSYDGTNFTTTQPLKFGYAMNGTTGVRAYTNFPPSVLDNVRKIKLSAIQDAHTASLFMTNIYYSHSNQ